MKIWWMLNYNVCDWRFFLKKKDYGKLNGYVGFQCHSLEENMVKRQKF